MYGALNHQKINIFQDIPVNPVMMSLQFNIFTLNCWGLFAVSKNRKVRMQAIAEYLAINQYDVVCLQEVWIDRDFFLIKDRVSGVLPYSHYFYSGVSGSGVCIFSKHPIEEAFFHQWSLNGYIHKLHHGDWFGGKGVGLCRLVVNSFVINIYSTHLHAEYDRNSDEYEAHRILQAYDTAQFILLTSQNADLVVLAGDLNTEPGDLAYRVILTIPGLLDAFEADKVQSDHIATYQNQRNSYTPANVINDQLPGQRIDYIMFHPGSKLRVDLKKYRLPLPERVPGQSYSYSDHEGLAVTLEISEKSAEPVCRDPKEGKTVLKDMVTVLDRALDSLGTHQVIYLSFAFILCVGLVLSLAFEPPAGFFILINIIRAVIVVLLTYCFVMATIWNRIERHAVLAGKLAIETSLRKKCFS
ncbi:unnamed protein product [Phaedon cochleariae]|uniref:sphingomyelin phosphodiesterase n=1 Tax=Phaedon cochleariae TaxID=80249 RepID=A0A9P0DNC0_PHACE|nr:unnamed protein product [Phaedon cochleariae]